MFDYEKKFVKLQNCERIAYIEKGVGPVLLLIHGNMASSVHMVELANKLKDNYRVITPDLRSFGDSSFVNDFTTLKELAFDLTLFLNVLNIDSAYVAGWSTGFGVAMELAILNPKLVKGLLSLEGMSLKGYYSLKANKAGEVLSYRIYESYHQMKADRELNFISDALKSQDYNLIKSVWENTLLINRKVSEDILDLFVKETLKQRSQENINWCWVNFNISDEANLYSKGSSEYKSIKCPIHLTLGLKDSVVTKPMIMENVKAFKHAILHTFPNAGHCVHIDELDLVVNIIKENFI